MNQAILNKALDQWRGMSDMDRMRAGASVLPYIGLPDPLSVWTPEWLAACFIGTVVKDDGELHDWVMPTLKGVSKISPIQHDPESLCYFLCRMAAIRWVTNAFDILGAPPKNTPIKKKKSTRTKATTQPMEGEGERTVASQEDQPVR
jgi:hypothetical protein